MVLREGTPYTFSQILEQNSETEEILAELGYRFRSAPLSLQSKEDPRFALQVEEMRAQMRERLPFVPMNNEASARAYYVTPLLFAVLDQVRFKMNIEYAVAGGRLRGRVDYLLRGRHDLVAAGVMNEEMDSGFRKLAVQMVAVSEQLAMPTVEPVHPRRARKALRAGRALGGPKTVGFAKDVQTRLFGVVTAGPVWQFGVLDRGQKTVTRDTESYQLPRDLGRLVGILAGLLGEIESEQDDFKREGERLSWANS
ncbi:MAG: hypothetical protein F4148_11800 [Caldilineaceae bacterium SB0675_bin_29]|uniref:Uncharacterized protein n=1 Tax=Caldilineaceae bacterium SB0675_bin_29 TaxID=2605266 RepID=A0A6B1G0H3_9CHLR|nr:hypothetical protein [Caldilineaceae bacterium SB0675_bin_29]